MISERDFFNFGTVLMSLTFDLENLIIQSWLKMLSPLKIYQKMKWKWNENVCSHTFLCVTANWCYPGANKAYLKGKNLAIVGRKYFLLTKRNLTLREGKPFVTTHWDEGKRKDRKNNISLIVEIYPNKLYCLSPRQLCGWKCLYN